MKTYRLSPVRTEPTLQIQNRGHYSLMEGDKSSFSMSGHVPYSPTDTAIASAASASWIWRDFILPRMCFEQVSEYSACTVEGLQNSCSWAFATLYTLALCSFCGLPLPCCQAMSVKAVHGHGFLIFLHFRLGLTLIALVASLQHKVVDRSTHV